MATSVQSMEMRVLVMLMSAGCCVLGRSCQGAGSAQGDNRLGRGWKPRLGGVASRMGAGPGWGRGCREVTYRQKLRQAGA